MVVKRQKGLGRGLEALLGPTALDIPVVNVDGSASFLGGISLLRLDQLTAGKYQPRSHMDEGALYELAESIKTQGIMQPILVRPLMGGEQYEIIAGERRFRAAKLAGLESIPVLVKDVGDEAAAVMALIENMQREDLNPLEEALGLQRLIKEFGLTHEAAAQAGLYEAIYEFQRAAVIDATLGDPQNDPKKIQEVQSQHHGRAGITK